MGPWTCWVQGNKVAGKLTRGCSAQKFVGPELALGVSKQNMRNKIKRWVDNQHLAMWCGPGSTQRQAQELIAGPSPTKKTRLLSFWPSNWTYHHQKTSLFNGVD